jgi:DNA-binding NarL/FixJ family response regulator
LVYSLLSDPAALSLAAEGVLDADERAALVWAKPARTAKATKWSAGDAILIDEAAGLILAADPGIRVIILTTYETDASILTAMEAGASGYLLKAAPQEEILAGVRAVARGEVALSPSIAATLVRRVGRPSVSLSPRETEVLGLVANGLSNPEIAKRLFLGDATVKTHLLHVFEKLEVGDRTRAVTRAMELGLLGDPGGR